MKNSCLLFLWGVALLLLSCAHRAPAFSPNAAPDPRSAVFYGRFSINNGMNMFENKLALWLKNTDTKYNVYIYFDEAQPVYAVQVPAGPYRVAGFAALTRLHKLDGRQTFWIRGEPAAITRPFEAAAGSEIYLGDFTGHATFDGVICEWKVDSVTNNFVGTSREFREKYPNLRTASVTDVKDLQDQQESNYRQLQ
jgi:hypothetical protein